MDGSNVRNIPNSSFVLDLDQPKERSPDFRGTRDVFSTTSVGSIFYIWQGVVCQGLEQAAGSDPPIGPVGLEWPVENRAAVP